MKQAQKQALSPRRVRPERRQEDRPDPFREQREAQNGEQQPPDVSQPFRFQQAAERRMLPQLQAVSCDQAEKRSKGHDSQPAHLKQSQNDDLTFATPVRRRVFDDQSGHATGAGRCEQGRDERRTFCRPQLLLRTGSGKHQQGGPDGDQPEKRCDENPAWVDRAGRCAAKEPQRLGDGQADQAEFREGDESLPACRQSRRPSGQRRSQNQNAEQPGDPEAGDHERRAAFGQQRRAGQTPAITGGPRPGEPCHGQ